MNGDIGLHMFVFSNRFSVLLLVIVSVSRRSRSVRRVCTLSSTSNNSAAGAAVCPTHRLLRPYIFTAPFFVRLDISTITAAAAAACVDFLHSLTLTLPLSARFVPLRSSDGGVHYPSVAPEHRPPHRPRVAAHPVQGLAAGAEHKHRSLRAPAHVHRAHGALPGERGRCYGPQDEPGLVPRPGVLCYHSVPRCCVFVNYDAYLYVRVLRVFEGNVFVSPGLVRAKHCEARAEHRERFARA